MNPRRPPCQRGRHEPRRGPNRLSPSRRAPPSSSNRLPQPCIRMTVPSRRTTPIVRRASATMRLHPRDIWSQWPGRFVAPARPCTRMTRSSVASARLCAGQWPLSAGCRDLCLLWPRRYVPSAAFMRRTPVPSRVTTPIVRPADATMHLHSPVPPSHDRVPRPKGTGHAPQGCRWSGLSPGCNGALTRLGSGWLPAISERAPWTCALFSPSGSIFCASSRRSWHSP